MKFLSAASWLLLAALVLTASPDSCSGQVARYQPRTSTVSPYLNLTGRNNFGGLPNYFALVRPQIQQRQFNTQAARVTQLQALEIASLQSQLRQGVTPEGKTTGSNSWFMVPGAEHSFLNTNQFYPPKAPRRR
jgi:hypothetical protein